MIGKSEDRSVNGKSYGFLLFTSKSKRKKTKKIKILKHMRRKMKTKHSTAQHNRNIKIRFHNELVWKCMLVCMRIKPLDSYRHGRVCICIDLQNDNHARMMQIMHLKKLDIHLSNNLHISQSSFYNFAIAMAIATRAQLFLLHHHHHHSSSHRYHNIIIIFVIIVI